MNKTKEEIEQIAEHVVDAMLKVHRAMGPGLLESTYQTCLAHELRCRGIEVGCEVALPIRYEGIQIEAGYRIDMLVAECIIIENKSVQAILPIHEAQLLKSLTAKTPRARREQGMNKFARFLGVLGVFAVKWS